MFETRYFREDSFMKKLNAILNTIICTVIGAFVAHGVYIILDFKMNPGLYEMQSAPWYTSILMYGSVTVVVLIICIVIKAILKYKSKK